MEICRKVSGRRTGNCYNEWKDYGKVLKKMKYRVSEILELLRNKGIFDVNQVDFAIIEPNGQISALLIPEHQPLTPKDIKLKVSPSVISTELVYDGILIEENLKQLNKDKAWLLDQLTLT